MQIIYKLGLSIASWICFLIQKQLDGVQRNETKSQKIILNWQSVLNMNSLWCEVPKKQQDVMQQPMTCSQTKHLKTAYKCFLWQTDKLLNGMYFGL